jgi:hypothetical protein
VPDLAPQVHHRQEGRLHSEVDLRPAQGSLGSQPLPSVFMLKGLMYCLLKANNKCRSSLYCKVRLTIVI